MNSLQFRISEGFCLKLSFQIIRKFLFEACSNYPSIRNCDLASGKLRIELTDPMHLSVDLPANLSADRLVDLSASVWQSVCQAIVCQSNRLSSAISHRPIPGVQNYSTFSKKVRLSLCMSTAPDLNCSACPHASCSSCRLSCHSFISCHPPPLAGPVVRTFGRIR